MTCSHTKDCNCHQNSSFIFGLIIGLVIAAVVAIVIYRNNREDVFLKLKKQIEKFISSFKKSETFQNVSKIVDKVDINNSVKAKPPTKKTSKITVTLPPELIKKEFATKVISPKTKPRVFKK